MKGEVLRYLNAQIMPKHEFCCCMKKLGKTRALKFGGVLKVDESKQELSFTRDW